MGRFPHLQNHLSDAGGLLNAMNLCNTSLSFISDPGPSLNICQTSGSVAVSTLSVCSVEFL